MACLQTEDLDVLHKLNNKKSQNRKMESKYQKNKMDKKRKKNVVNDMINI